MSIVKRQISPLEVNAYPDSPLTAAHYANAMRETATLAFRGSGNVHTLFYDHALGAPATTLASAGSYGTFSMRDENTTEDQTFQIPWQVQNQYDHILAFITYVCSRSYMLQFRLKTTQLVDSVADTSGNGVFTRRAGGRVMMYNWDEIDMRRGSVLCTVEPTLPSSRRIAVQPEVQIKTGFSLFNQGGSTEVRIVSVTLMDRWKEPV